MSAPTSIYGLADPTTGQLRYVGKTTKPRRRLDEHIADARRGVNRPSSHWIRSLLKKGQRPEIFEIEECGAGTDWEEAEQFWIAYFRSIGCRLLNLSIGGGSGSLGWRATAEQRARRSLATRGRIVSADTRRRIGLANTGRPHTERQRRLNSEAKRGEKSTKAKIKATDVPVIRSLIASGYSGAQVGSLYGITKQAADAIFHRESWRHVPEVDVDISRIVVPPVYRLRGKDVGTSKLTEEAVRDIRRRLVGKRGSRESGKSLAAEYGVSTTIISDVRNRKIWRHVA